MKSRKYLIVALFAILVYAYFSEAFSFDKVLAYRDLSRYFYPLRLFTVDSIRNGIIPLWNPYIFCGVPHLALQQSVIFYPLSFIYYILPFNAAFNIFLVMHYFLAGIFMYLLARQWQISRLSAILAGVVFTFNGYMVSILNLATTLSSVIWLPLALLLFDRSLKKASMMNISAASLSLAVMFLGGEPSIFYSTLLVLAIYLFFFCLNAGGERPARSLIKVFLAIACIAALLSAIQLLPFLELSKFSDRAKPVPFEKITQWSLPVKGTLELFIPFITKIDFSEAAYWKEQSWLLFIYTGAMSLPFIFLSLYLKRNWRVSFLLFLAALFLFVSYGRNTPFYLLLYKYLPGFKFVRYPIRFLHVAIFAISIFYAFGLEAYFAARNRHDRRLYRLFDFVLPILLAISIFILVFYLYEGNIMDKAVEFCRKIPGLAKGCTMLDAFTLSILLSLEKCAVFLTSGLFILFLGVKMKPRNGVIAFSVISIILADLLGAPFTAAGSASISKDIINTPPPNVRHILKDRSFFRLFASPAIYKRTLFVRGDSFEEGYKINQDLLCANLPMVFGLYDAGGYDSIMLRRHDRLLGAVEKPGSDRDNKILDMLNVKYLLASDKLDNENYKLLNTGSGAYLYENRGALPRAFLVDSFRVIKDEEGVIARLISKGFDPSKEAILEEKPILAFSRQPSVFSLKEKVEIIKYSPNEVTIRAAVDSPKFLVLADQYYPGWKAYVDGRREYIYRADFVLRSVYLNNGRHIVRFIFDPFSFKLGLAITLSTFFIMAALVFIKRR